MKNQTVHDATVTLKLPASVKGRALVDALRNAGIPVDVVGNVASGYLFVRTTGRFAKRANTFRWFAAGSSEEAVAAFAMPGGASDPQDRAASDGDGALAPSHVQESVPTSVVYLRLWKELEQHARRAENDLHEKRIAYFRGLGPPPDAVDWELVKQARATADQCLAAAQDEMSRHVVQGRGRLAPADG